MDPEAILATLNTEQREAAQAVTGPVVILAGAGTGKTRVISHRVALCRGNGRYRSEARARRHVHREGRR